MTNVCDDARCDGRDTRGFGANVFGEEGVRIWWDDEKGEEPFAKRRRGMSLPSPQVMGKSKCDSRINVR